MNDNFNYEPKKFITNMSEYLLLNKKDIEEPCPIDIKINEDFCMYQDYVKEKMDQINKEIEHRNIIELLSYKYHLEEEIERINNPYKNIEMFIEERKIQNINAFSNIVGLSSSDFNFSLNKNIKNKETSLPK